MSTNGTGRECAWCSAVRGTSCPGASCRQFPQFVRDPAAPIASGSLQKTLTPAGHASPQCSDRRRGPPSRTQAPRRKPLWLRGSADGQVTPAERRGKLPILLLRLATRALVAPPPQAPTCGTERSRRRFTLVYSETAFASVPARFAADVEGAGPTSARAGGGGRARVCVRAREWREWGPARACAGAGRPLGPSGR